MFRALHQRVLIVVATVTVSVAVSVIASACAPAGAPVGSTIPGTIPEPQEESVTQPNQPRDLASVAQADLAEHLAMPIDEISVVNVRPMTWPDSSLGCGRAGGMYAQVIEEGFVIRLQAGGEMYFYHSGRDQVPFRCDEPSLFLPKTPPGVDDELVPPPGSEIDATE